MDDLATRPAVASAMRFRRFPNMPTIAEDRASIRAVLSRNMPRVSGVAPQSVVRAMDRATEYRRNAEFCQQMANDAHDDEDRGSVA
jgi:hypothetical protein